MRLRRLAALIALVFALAPAAPALGRGNAGTTAPRSSAADQVTPATTPQWLQRLNRYRTLAGLPAATENTTWSSGDRAHAKYMVKNDVIAHDEDSSKPFYTAAGNTAAKNGNVMVSSLASTTDIYAINGWMEGPFHAVGMIDPALRRTGYGSFRASDGGWQMAATLDVIRGLGAIPSGVTFPIKYPSGSGEVPIRTFTGNEYPDPLSSCPGYSAPSGIPIVLQIGNGSLTPNVTAHSLKLAGVNVPSCEFDETNYVNTDPNAQSLARAILDGRDAIVLMAKKPLKQGKTYQVSIRANGTTYTWSFRVGANAA